MALAGWSRKLISLPTSLTKEGPAFYHQCAGGTEQGADLPTPVSQNRQRSDSPARAVSPEYGGQLNTHTH